ncbi:NUDIX hydrolase [Vallitalea sp.]|uniref:NUDIX hydrolase n=1 Tax=Vallitalea sp. TaxID=1882829 RepID=UPI0025D57433|nr:NUDIX hydrolase [Vallitalea sp.]MCT4687010.1 NUDIX hydrolase [Vallitalea sp.]
MANYMDDLRELIGTRPVIACGANVVIMDKDNRILLHHRQDNDMWGLPGGMMELGESLEENAIREVKEETGLECNELRLFNVYSGKELYYQYPDGNEVYNVTVTYICKRYSGIIEVDLSEGKEVKYFAVDEIPNQISPPVKIIIEDYKKRFNELIKL